MMASIKDGEHITALLAKARAEWDAMTLLEKAICHAQQRASYIRGEMMLGPENGEVGGMTAEQFAKLPKDDGTLLVEEITRLRTALAARDAEIADLRTQLSKDLKSDFDLAEAERRIVARDAALKQARESLEPFQKAAESLTAHKIDSVNMFFFGPDGSGGPLIVHGNPFSPIRAAIRAIDEVMK